MKFMEEAVLEAKKSQGDIPVGAVIVKNGEIIARAHNLKEKLNDLTCHAEILAIREAEKKLGNWRLLNCKMYVTLEPCPMCAWAILSSGIEAVYFGACDPNYGALGSKINLTLLSLRKPEIYGGIMEVECKKILDEYFEKMRSK